MVSPRTAAILTDDKLFAETLIQIDDRFGNIQQFKYNAAQSILYDNLSNRTLTVKAGQLGITTFFLARGFKKVITEHNRTAVVVAHEEFLTQRLLNRVQVMYDRLPLPPNRKPKMHHSSTYEKSFPTRNCTFYIGTAGAKVFGRGEPIHYFLGSEFAFWPDPNKILGPVEDRVPLAEGCELHLESTPNGTGTPDEPNVFYQLVQEALQGNSIWKLNQLPWWLEPSYRLPIGSKYALVQDQPRITNFTQIELDLIARTGWQDNEADERIRWRRMKIESKRREHGAFLQEFFEDIVSCFYTTAQPFYEPEVIDKLRSSCYPAPDRHGLAEVWFQPGAPEDNPNYIITVDPGQGKATRSVALVWRVDLDNYTRVRHEATIAGKYDPKAFAPLVKQLGQYYYNAKIIPEANGHGMAFCTEIDTYPNLYYRSDVVSGISGKQIGWFTTGAAKIGGSGTKIYMLTQLQSMLHLIETHDINLVNELSQVKYSGANVKFLSSDDYHDAAAIMAGTHHITGGVMQARGYVGRAGYTEW